MLSNCVASAPAAGRINLATRAVGHPLAIWGCSTPEQSGCHASVACLQKTIACIRAALNLSQAGIQWRKAELRGRGRPCLPAKRASRAQGADGTGIAKGSIQGTSAQGWLTGHAWLTRWRKSAWGGHGSGHTGGGQGMLGLMHCAVQRRSSAVHGESQE